MRFSNTSKIYLVILCLLPFLATGSPQFGGVNFCMKKIPLTGGYFALVDDEDFEWLSRYKWQLSTSSKGDHRYAIHQRWGKKSLLMHRLILSAKDGELVDHKDYDGLNNQRSNIRKCSKSQNTVNQRPKSHSSKYRGVSFYKAYKKWEAQICKDGKRYKLGYFNNEIEAAIAWNNAAIELYGEFAPLNNIKE